MRRRRRLGWSSILASLFLSACQNSEPVKIGVVLDRDGVRGAVLAAADVNAAGGIHGRPMQLRILHGLSSTSARDALSAAQTLAADPTVLAVIGHTNSAASLAAAQIYNEQEVVQIAPTSSAPLYSSAGPWSFRLVATDLHQGTLLGNIIAADPSHPRVAVLYVNDDYGRAIHGTLLSSLSPHSITPVYEAPFEEGARFGDVSAFSRAIARSKPDLLVWLGRSEQLRLLLPRLRKELPAVRVLASDGFSGPQLERYPEPAFIGIRYIRFLDPRSASPGVKRIAKYYSENWHGEFTDQYSLSYDAVRLLADAIRDGGASRKDIREYLETLGNSHPAFVGISRSITFDSNGDPPPSYVLAEVTQDGAKILALPAGPK